MQTLHEYMMETKAIEYILAVVFLVVFILFWRFVQSDRKVRDRTTLRRGETDV